MSSQKIHAVLLALFTTLSMQAVATPQESERPPAATVGPYIPHTGGADGADGVIGVETRLRDLPPAKGDLRQGPVSAHIQGEFVQTGSQDQDDVNDSDLTSGDNTPIATPVLEDDRAALGEGGFVVEFEGLSNTGWIPPDTQVAVGPQHLVEATNAGFAIYSRTGRTIQGYTTFQNLFAPVVPSGWGGFMFDPRLLYLRSSNNPTSEGRWLMLAIGRDNGNQTSHVFTAVSQSEDPEGDWWLYRHDNTFANSNDSDAWLDYCGMSGDNWGIYITCNMFNWGGGFKHAKLYSLNPAMFSGGASNGWAFWNLEWPGGASAFTLQPASPHSIAGGDETFFLNSFSSSGSDVLLWTLTGDRTNTPTLAKSEVDVDSYDAIGENVNQDDSATDIDGGDARILQAVYNQRHVFATLTDDVNADGNSSGAYTMKINVDSATKVWDHLLWTGSDEYVFYPAITFQDAFSANANIGIMASWSTSTSFVDAVFKIYDNQPTDTTGPFLIYETGDAAYVDLDSNNKNRWGDYSGAHYDWSCDHLWGAVEVAGTGNSWRTRIRATTFGTEAPCALLDVTSPGSGDSLSGLSQAIITWDSRNVPSGDSLSLYYSTNGGDTKQLITSNLPSTTTSYNWLVPDEPTNQAKIELRTSSGISDWSDDVFTIGPCPDDAFEGSDDTCFGPVQAAGTTTTRLHCDADWVTFDTTPGTTYRVETSNLIGGADTVLEIYDNCTGPLVTDDDGGVGLGSYIEWTANQRFQDIQVRQFNNNYRAGEGYDLTIELCDASCELLMQSGFE